MLSRPSPGRLCGLALGLALLLGPSASAGRGDNQPLALVLSSRQTDRIVEQQSAGWPTATPELWVTNDTSCIWDVDDNANWLGQGHLSGGAALEHRDCLVGDGTPHWFTLRVYAPSDGLRVELSFPAQGMTFQAVPVDRGRNVEYVVCVGGPDYPLPLLLPEVTGSNGGHGNVGEVVATIENPGPRGAKSVDAQFAYGGWVQASGLCKFTNQTVAAADDSRFYLMTW